MVARWITVLSSALALGAVAGGILFAFDDADAVVTEPPVFERLTDRVPPHPGSMFFPLGAGMHLDARSREMGWALTDDPPRKVADRYEAIWNSQGLEVKRRVSPTEQWVIAHVPGQTEVRSVVVARDPDGPTTIVASVSEQAPESTRRVARPDSCELVSSTGAVDQNVHTEMALLDCRLGIDEIVDYYDRQAPSARFSVLVDRDGVHRDAHVTFESEALQITLAMTQVDKAPPRTAVSVTWQTREGP